MVLISIDIIDLSPAGSFTFVALFWFGSCLLSHFLLHHSLRRWTSDSLSCAPDASLPLCHPFETVKHGLWWISPRLAVTDETSFFKLPQVAQTVAPLVTATSPFVFLSWLSTYDSQIYISASSPSISGCGYAPLGEPGNVLPAGSEPQSTLTFKTHISIRDQPRFESTQKEEQQVLSHKRDSGYTTKDFTIYARSIHYLLVLQTLQLTESDAVKDKLFF